MSDNQDLENTIIIELKDGPVHITLLPEWHHFTVLE